jgi:signal transduction histidine kinase
VTDGESYVEVWATSKNKPEEVFSNDGEIREMMELISERAEIIVLDSGQAVWRVYMPIRDSRPGRNAKALLRAYCNLDRWNIVWKSTYTFTLKMLPIVLLLEFALLWVLTSAFVRRPMHKILMAMKSLGQGDASARANLRSQNELGQIARRFDAMADDLQEMSREREKLLSEIQGFNATLQERIDAALSELQTKNSELELLMERISLLREELSQQERLAVAGQLTAAFAHEIGTPLNLVNSHLQLLISESSIDNRTRDRLSTIHLQIDRVGEIVRRLLGLTRPIEPKRELTDLLPLLEELQRLWAPTLTARKVRLQAQTQENCLIWVDRKQLEQVFINLVNNAVDAMPDGGSIELKVAQNHSLDWEFALSDTGTGIPAENLNRVFKPMFSTKPEGKGTGLGLSICREIIKANSGEIRIESKEGHGTTVRFTLPANERSES